MTISIVVAIDDVTEFIQGKMKGVIEEERKERMDGIKLELCKGAILPNGKKCDMEGGVGPFGAQTLSSDLAYSCFIL